MSLSVDIIKHYPHFTLQAAFTTEDEPLGILGASGSGKSLTLRCIAGLIRPDRGSILLNGRVLFDAQRGIDVKPQQRRIGLVFQNYALFPHLTVAQNIAFGLAGLSKEEQRQHVDTLLEMMGLASRRHTYPRHLSGGEQQRTALARALAPQPELLLLDEPFAALDTHLRDQLEKEMSSVFSRYSGNTLLVSHNLDECYRLSRRILVMNSGRVCAVGSREDIFQRPATSAIARLTGCLNLSQVRPLAPDQIEALDWKCILTAPGADRWEAVGIRQQHLEVLTAGDGNAVGSANTFPCWLTGYTQGPTSTRVSFTLSPPSGEEVALDSENSFLHVDLSNERFSALSGHPLPWLLRIDPAYLLGLSRD